MAHGKKALRETIRLDLIGQGAPRRRIAAEIGRQTAARPRLAWRHAMGWPGWKLVQEFRLANPGMSISVSRVSEWESWPLGGAKPSPPVLSALARAFGHGCAPEDLVDDLDAEHYTPAEIELIRPGHVPAEPIAGPAPTAPAGGVDAYLVDAFGVQLDTAKIIDGRYGAAAALPSALGVVGGLRALAPDVPDRHRAAALKLAAEAAEFTGWLFRDLADATKAAYWYDQAMEAAQLCGDLSMQGYILIRKSQMAYDARAGHQVRAFAQAILDGPWRLTDHHRAEATLQHLKGQLMCGRAVDVNDAVARARSLSDGSPAVLDLREAPCWTEAGQPDRAADLYRAVLDGDALSARDRGFFTARRSSALALAGEARRSADDALAALASAGVYGSRRTENLVRATLPTLAPWRDVPEVEQLAAALSAA